jgi:hypothetical protein
MSAFPAKPQPHSRRLICSCCSFVPLANFAIGQSGGVSVKRIERIAFFVFVMCTVGQSAIAQSRPANPESTVLPSGTKIELVVAAPVWARTAKAGDALYTQVDFPVLTGKSIAIPAGTYVQGSILSIARPSRFKSRAEIHVLFTTLIFDNGYAVQLPPLPSVAAPAPGGSDAVPASPPAAAPAAMKLNVAVSASNDLLLDNGTQFDLVLASPLALDPNQVAAAIAASRTFDLSSIKSATLCRPTPGTPGTPGTSDTVIPGSPGTPDITIPGAPGQPDTVIPGIPASPPTVIPGSPGTPGFPGQSCPSAPIVTSGELLSAPSTPNAALITPKHP